MRTLFVDSNHSILHETLQSAGFNCFLSWDKPTEALLEEIGNYEILVIRSRFKLSREIIDKATRLKCIARIGAGLENIDTTHAASKNILCLSVPEGNRDAVGEHALGMLLMLMNHLKKADAEVRQGIWLRAENRGHEISGKTVGLIGYGNTGSSFAAKLSGFGCCILAHDKYKKKFGNSIVRECTLEELMEESDIISLHVPLTSETEYMVNDGFFTRLKKPVYFMNTARGKCVETKALVNALESGKVLGACLDVLEYESTSFEQIDSSRLPEPFQYLIHSSKVILTPHIAGWTHESNYKMSLLMAQKIIKAFGNQKSSE